MADRPQFPRILAIHAHPDDIEFQCAGTLALLKQQGCQITIVNMTAGDCGSAEMGPEEISKVRRAEGRRSAELLGADFMSLEFEDFLILVDREGRRKVTEAVRRARPDIVLTAPPIDYISDHEMASRLVRDACFMAPAPNFATHQGDPAPAIDKIPHLYYVDSLEGKDWLGNKIKPDFIVDISATYQLKRDMLACHASQRNWLLKQHGIDEYLESCDHWSAVRGREIDVPYGEAFRQHVGHPYPSDNWLLELVSG